MMSEANQRRRAPPPGFQWPGDPNLILRRNSPARRPRSAGSGMDSVRRRAYQHPRSPSSPPQRGPVEQLVAPRGGQNIGVSMGTQTSASAQTQTTPGVLRRGEESVPPSGNRVSIFDGAPAERALANQVAAPANGGAPLALEHSSSVAWATSVETARINPTTSTGQKLFLENSKGLPVDQRLDLTQANGKKIHRFFRANEVNIRSSTEVQLYDVNGRKGRVLNLLRQYHLISLDDCIKEGHVLFQEGYDPSNYVPHQKGPFLATTLMPATNLAHQNRYYDIVDNNIAVKLMQNTLTYDGWNKLLQKSNLFTYMSSSGRLEYHAKTMLYLIEKRVNPTTETSMSLYIQELRGARLNQHNNDVSELVTFLTEKHTILFDHGHAPTDYRRIVLDALGSGPNNSFNNYIARLEDEYEAGNGIRVRLEPDQILVLAEEKYIDMKKRNIWHLVDPKDAQIMALTTQVKELQDARNSNATALATSGASNKPFNLQDRSTWTKIPGTKIFKWRTEKQGNTLDVCGKTIYWCEHCNRYGFHKPENCNKLKSNSGDGKGSNDSGNQSGNKTTQNSQGTQLQFTNNLKSALSTSLCMSDEDIEKLFEKAKAGN